jgi:hypothetical protein
LGIFVVLFLLGIVVPKWYVTKLEKEIALKNEAIDTEREISRQATAQLSIANQLVGELRAIAIAKTADRADSHSVPLHDIGEHAQYQIGPPSDPRGSGT